MKKDNDFSNDFLKNQFEEWASIGIKSMQDSFEQLKRIQEEALKTHMEAKFNKQEPDKPDDQK